VVFGVSPGSFLASFFSQPAPQPALVVVTGESGAGKTRWCQQLAELAAARGWKAAGLLSPAVFENGLKTGIDLLDLSSGERRRLAARRDPAAPQGDFDTRHWSLDAETLAWGNRALEHAGPCDLLIVDELGPLELVGGAGLQAGLELLDARRYRLACAVVRPSLLAAAQGRWPHSQVVSLDDPDR
jgi:nucleoside-triphosphatase